MVSENVISDEEFLDMISEYYKEMENINNNFKDTAQALRKKDEHNIIIKNVPKLPKSMYKFAKSEFHNGKDIGTILKSISLSLIQQLDNLKNNNYESNIEFYQNLKVLSTYKTVFKNFQLSEVNEKYVEVFNYFLNTFLKTFGLISWPTVNNSFLNNLEKVFELPQIEEFNNSLISLLENKMTTSLDNINNNTNNYLSIGPELGLNSLLTFFEVHNSINSLFNKKEFEPKLDLLKKVEPIFKNYVMSLTKFNSVLNPDKNQTQRYYSMLKIVETYNFSEDYIKIISDLLKKHLIDLGEINNFVIESYVPKTLSNIIKIYEGFYELAKEKNLDIIQDITNSIEEHILSRLRESMIVINKNEIEEKEYNPYLRDIHDKRRKKVKFYCSKLYDLNRLIKEHEKDLYEEISSTRKTVSNHYTI